MKNPKPFIAARPAQQANFQENLRQISAKAPNQPITEERLAELIGLAALSVDQPDVKYKLKDNSFAPGPDACGIHGGTNRAHTAEIKKVKVNSDNPARHLTQTANGVQGSKHYLNNWAKEQFQKGKK